MYLIFLVVIILSIWLKNHTNFNYSINDKDPEILIFFNKYSLKLNDSFLLRIYKTQ